ncbi:MAG: hypothetical protein QW763_06860 [Archaeoglobaceae archaeon]
MFEVVFDFEEFKEIAKNNYRYVVGYKFLNQFEAIVRLRIYALHREGHVVVYETGKRINQFNLKDGKFEDAIRRQIEEFRDFAEKAGAKPGYFSLGLNPDE